MASLSTHRQIAALVVRRHLLIYAVFISTAMLLAVLLVVLRRVLMIFYVMVLLGLDADVMVMLVRPVAT